MFHISYVQTHHNEPFNEIGGSVGSISDIEFLKNFILWQHKASAEKICQIVIISHNSVQFKALNICIVCYITNYQSSRISKLILYHLQS